MAAVYYSIRYLKEQPRCRLRKGKYSISTYIPKRKNQVRIINKLSTYQHFINKLSTKKSGFRSYGRARARLYARARAAAGGWLAIEFAQREGGSWRLKFVRIVRKKRN